jgi:hypothetical protein
MATFTLDQLMEMQGAPVLDVAGERIGRIEEVYYDMATRAPEWIGIGTGFLGMKRVLVPAQGAEPEGGGLRVPYPRDLVKDSPEVAALAVSEETERSLCAHYGLRYSYELSPTGFPESAPGRDVPGPGAAAEEMTPGGGTIREHTLALWQWPGRAMEEAAGRAGVPSLDAWPDELTAEQKSGGVQDAASSPVRPTAGEKPVPAAQPAPESPGQHRATISELRERLRTPELVSGTDAVALPSGRPRPGEPQSSRPRGRRMYAGIAIGALLVPALLLIGRRARKSA